MSCETSDILSAYCDGELAPADAERVRLHLAECPRCQGELAEIRQLSAAIGGEAQSLQILPIELARMQAGVQASIRVTNTRGSLFRAAAMLSALAASILIIAGAWLLDLEQSPAPAVGAQARQAVAVPDWERLACTLRAEPRPGLATDASPYSLRYAAAVEWMLRNHTAEGPVTGESD